MLVKMKTSKLGVELLKQSEGCSSKVKGKNRILSQVDIDANILVYPYYCSANHLTIGWGCRVNDDKGNLIYGNDFSNGVLVSECEKLFEGRLSKDFEVYINKWLKVQINQNQFDALVCLCFNRPAWAKRIITDIINIDQKNNIDKITNLWLGFCTVNGVHDKGILARRQRELELYFKIC